MLISPNPVTNKKVQHKNASPNDYVSLGTYWWENPDTEDGLPYIRHDGILMLGL